MEDNTLHEDKDVAEQFICDAKVKDFPQLESGSSTSVHILRWIK